jgi:hypothetical protein
VTTAPKRAIVASGFVSSPLKTLQKVRGPGGLDGIPPLSVISRKKL